MLSGAASLGAGPMRTAASAAGTGAQVQARMTADAAAGRPLVIHVVVALCDNEHQGIVPVPIRLGNGRDPASNLYWGARYGVRSYLAREAGWKERTSARPSDARILARTVFFDRIARGGSSVPVYVVADAWDGAQIKAAIGRFLEIGAGRAGEEVRAGQGDEAVTLRAGGDAHVVAFVGHDGLMDFSVASVIGGPASTAVAGEPAGAARSAIVLACASKSYFLAHLRRAGAHPLLLTTGLMAPEAYSLDAAIRAWVGGGPTSAVRDAAASAYDRHQHCGARAARALFTAER